MPALPSFSVRYHSLSGTPQILVISRVSGQTTLKLRRRQASMGVFLVTFIIAFSPVLKFSFYHHFSDNDNLKSRVLSLSFSRVFLRAFFYKSVSCVFFLWNLRAIWRISTHETSL